MTVLGRSYPSGGRASFNFLAKIDGIIVGQCQVYHIYVGYSNPTPHGPAGFSFFETFLESVSLKKCLMKLRF